MPVKLTDSQRDSAQLRRAHERTQVQRHSRAEHESPGAERRSPAGLQRAIQEPQSAHPGDLLQLQRLIGNRAVNAFLGGGAAAHPLQAKLTVGAAHDPYEQEADRVADQVMSGPASAEGGVQRQGEEEEIQTKPLAAGISRLGLQRQEDEEEIQTSRIQRQGEEEEIQTSRLQRQEDEEEIQTKPIQRQGEEEEIQTSRLQRQEDEEEIQTKPIQRQEDEEEIQTSRLQRQEDPQGSFDAGEDIEGRLAASRGSGAPLPDDTRGFMEQRFGADFSGVRVHTGAESASINRELSAQAFTHGQDIYLGEGKDNLGSSAGQHLLAHELTHVIQQTGGGAAG